MREVQGLRGIFLVAKHDVVWGKPPLTARHDEVVDHDAWRRNRLRRDVEVGDAGGHDVLLEKGDRIEADRSVTGTYDEASAFLGDDQIAGGKDLLARARRTRRVDLEVPVVPRAR